MISKNNLLIFIPTYNERENVKPLCQRISALGLDCDILFMDDNSPDGTGSILEALSKENKHIFVIHRIGKLGIGSAHHQGIQWAYGHGYKMLITMDCDFTHPPEIILEVLKNIDDSDIVVGSRYMLRDSLAGWHFHRIVLTRLGHFLTKTLLGLPYDATGALRFYRLDRIPAYVFDLVSSKGYSFLYESLFILHVNQFRIKEIPIKLPARTYGHSKMRVGDVLQSLKLLVSICFRKIFVRKDFIMMEPFTLSNGQAQLLDGAEWEIYWGQQKGAVGSLYDIIASFYRSFIIKGILNYFIHKYFKNGSSVLHAGCGGGQVDADVSKYLNVIAMDYSVHALNLYKRNNDGRGQLLYGNIFHIPLPDCSVDGVYNLGVMEHYSERDILRILGEFKRILKPGALIVLFWPPQFGISVLFLKCFHFILKNILKARNKMHPDEVCLIRSRAHVTSIVHAAGFDMVKYYFGPKDLFTCCVIVIKSAMKPENS